MLLDYHYYHSYLDRIPRSTSIILVNYNKNSQIAADL